MNITRARRFVDLPWKVIFIISQLSSDTGSEINSSEGRTVRALVRTCRDLKSNKKYTASIFYTAGQGQIFQYKIMNAQETVNITDIKAETIELSLTKFILAEMRDQRYRYACYVCGHSWMIYMILNKARTCCRALNNCSDEESKNVISVSFYADIFKSFQIKTDLFLADSCSFASYESASTIAPYTKYYLAHMLCTYDEGYVSAKTLTMFCENTSTETMVKAIHSDYFVRNINLKVAASDTSIIAEATIVHCEPFKKVIELLNELYRNNNRVFYRYKGFERNLVFPKYRVLDLYSYIVHHPNIPDDKKRTFRYWFNQSITYNQHVNNSTRDLREFSGVLPEGCYEPGSPEDIEQPEASELPEDPVEGYPVKHGLAFFIEEPCWTYDQIIECVSKFVKVSERGNLSR